MSSRHLPSATSGSSNRALQEVSTSIMQGPSQALAVPHVSRVLHPQIQTTCKNAQVGHQCRSTLTGTYFTQPSLETYCSESKFKCRAPDEFRRQTSKLVKRLIVALPASGLEVEVNISRYSTSEFQGCLEFVVNLGFGAAAVPRNC